MRVVLRFSAATPCNPEVFMPNLVVTTPYPISRIGRLCGALSAKAEVGPSGLARIRVGPDADAVQLRTLTDALRPLRLAV